MDDTHKKYSLLVIEDDEFMRDLLAQRFSREPARVRFAGNADEALKELKEEKPDIILLDILLPGKTGFEIKEEINKDENFKSIPVIFLTNLGQREDIERAQKLGGVDYLIKASHSLDEIVEAVHRHVKK